MIYESRYDKLMSMYWNATRIEYDEKLKETPSEAVLFACSVTKKKVMEEIDCRGYRGANAYRVIES